MAAVSEPDQRSTVEGCRLQAALGSVLLLTGIFFLSFVARVGMGPLMPAIEGDLGLGHAQAGSVFLFLSLGYCAGLLSSGLLSSRLTHRRTVIASSVAVGAALLGTSAAGGIGTLRVGVALLGAAAGLYLPAGIATITALLRPADWGKAFAVHELAPNASFFAAPLLVEALYGWFSWRAVLALLGIAAILGGGAFAKLARGGGTRGAAPHPAAVKAALSNPHFWVLTILFGLVLGASLGVYTMLPLYLVAHAGMEGAAANTLVAWSRAAGIFTVFGAGWLGDRCGTRTTMALVLAFTGSCTALLGMVDGPWLVVAVFLQPVLAVCFFPVGFVELSRVSPLGVSLAIPTAIVLGGGGIPAVVGWLADRGHFPEALVLVGVLILAGAGLPRLLAVPLDRGAVAGVG